LQRGGDPVFYDRALATLQGCEAIKSILTCTPDTPSPFIAISENKIVARPLIEAVKLTKEVPDAIVAKDFVKVRQLRDAEFNENMNLFSILNSIDQPQLLLPKEQRLNIGIIHVGAPCGGMNSAARAAIGYCIARGHTPIGFYNGFSGMIRHHSDKPVGSVRHFDWKEVDRWCVQGGCNIGSNRSQPGDNLSEVAFVFAEYKIDALFLVGGFEAFTALSQLRKGREQYDEFRIPMVCLPATVSNNVPGTEYSLGSDTCLNALLEYVDTLRQSAEGSRRRVFVVETQGGESGYIATMAGLACGSLAVYTPEEGITLDMLNNDIKHLKETFAQDRGQDRAGE
jgi:6-phosphofructokinase 1